MNRFRAGMLVLALLVLRPPETAAQSTQADASQDSLYVAPTEQPSGPAPTENSSGLAPSEQLSSVPPAAGGESGPSSSPRPSGSRNARLAMLASLGFPGLGQLYNDEGWKTIVVFTWETYYIGRILRYGQQADFYRRKADALGEGETWRGLGYSELRGRFDRQIERETDYIWYSGALILASVLDAYVFAHLYDFETDNVRGRRGVVLPLVDHEQRSIGLQFWLHF